MISQEIIIINTRNNTNNKKLQTIAILSFFVFSTSSGTILPLLQMLIERYPEVPVTTIRFAATLPSLIALFTGTLFGLVIGKKIKFKTVALFSLICFTVGGILPVFLIGKSFTLILISRVIFGIGYGGFLCRNALVLRSYDKETAAKMLGIGVAVGNICGTIISQSVGLLGDISLAWGFAIHILGIVPMLLIIFFFKEPEKEEENQSQLLNESAAKAKIGPRAWLYIIMTFIATVTLYPAPAFMSSHLTYLGITSATLSGTMLSIYILGGAIGGMLFGKLVKKLGKYMISLAFLIAAVGVVILLTTKIIPAIIVGIFCAGIGFYWVIPTFSTYVKSCVPVQKQALASTLIVSATQAGVAVSAYWITISNFVFGGYFDTDIQRSFLGCIIVYLAVVVISVIIDLRPKEITEKTQVN